MESEEEDEELWNKSVDEISDCSRAQKAGSIVDATLKGKHLIVKDTHCQHSRVILHIDIDCFYAQVEMIRNPALRNKPLGIQQKNIIVTCNYPARERGLTKLMYIKDAKAKCPEMVLVSGEDLTKYREMSYKISEFLQTYCPLVERLGFDENFLDITNLVADRLTSVGPDVEVNGHLYESEAASIPCSCGCRRRLTVGSQIAAEIRASLHQELGITCCGGVAHNKLLSKLVAGTHKPNQQTTLYPEYAPSLMGKLASVRNIPGIGHATARRMKEMGIASIQDLHLAHSSLLEEEFGAGTADTIRKLGRGIDESPVVAFGLPQTLSVEDSFKKCCTLDDVRLRVNQLLTHLLDRLLKDGRTAHTLRLTLRNRIKGYTRESRQCAIPPSLLAKLSADTLPKVCSQMETLAVGLVTKLIDPKQPFHLTLINVAFAKLEQKSGSGRITEFFSQKPSSNQSQSQVSQSNSGEAQLTGLLSGSQTGTQNVQSQQTGLQGENQAVVNQSEFSQHTTNTTSPPSKSTTTQKEVDNLTMLKRRGKDEQKNPPGLFKWFSKSAAKQRELQEIKPDICSTKGTEHSKDHPISSQTSRAFGNKEYVTIIEESEKQGASFFKSVRRKAATSPPEESHNNKRPRLTDKNSNSVGADKNSNSAGVNIPADIDRAVYDELPVDIQQEILATTTHNASAACNAIEATDKSYMNRQSRETAVIISEDGSSTEHNSFEGSSTSVKAQASDHHVEERLTNTCKAVDNILSRANVSKSNADSTDYKSETGSASHLTSKDAAKDTIIPPGIDKSVFVSLPREIQDDLLKEWKSKSQSGASSERRPHKAPKSAGIMSYFHKSDKG